jgi:CubicO group peptidase (beta-lactamase class C family)
MNVDEKHQEFVRAIETTLQPLIEQVMASYGLAGLAVGIVRDNTLVYANGFGVRNILTQDPVTPESLFHLASISKPFVATAIMQLVEQGLVDLQRPVASYLPYFRLSDERSKTITVQQMLSHTGGVPNIYEYDWHAPEVDEGALERYVRSLASKESIHAPGEEYEYSNAAFEVLGDLVAKVSGQPFETYIQEHIFAPLQMHASTFLRQEVRPELALTPHFGMPVMTLDDAYPYNRAHAPSSTLHSNVIEMSHWAIANMQRGEFRGSRILQAESYDRLWHRYVETGEETWGEAVGLSWFFGTYGGHEVIHHGGSDPGFQAEFVMLPQRGDAVLVAANSNTAGAAAVTDAALDLILGLEGTQPKPSIAVAVAALLKSQGMAAAVEEYRRLKESQPEDLNFGPGRFMDACWGAVEVHKGESVMDLLQLWLAVQPEASEAHEMMGWEYLLRGDKEQALGYVRRALELDPENDHATEMLEQLSV